MSLLIVGKNKEKRKKKALEIAKDKYKSSKYDLEFLEPESEKSTIPIEKIKELKKKSFLKPFNSPSKTIVIHEFEKTTLEAQNALLKLLEEPPNYTYIIITAPSTSSLLPTIISRCNVLTIEKQEKLDQEKLLEILKETESLFNGKIGEKFEKAEELAKDKEKTIEYLEKIIFALREVLLLKFESSPSHVKENLIKKLSVSRLKSLLKKLDRAVFTLKTTNASHRLLLENLLLEFRLK